MPAEVSCIDLKKNAPLSPDLLAANGEVRAKRERIKESSRRANSRFADKTSEKNPSSQMLLARARILRNYSTKGISNKFLIRSQIDWEGKNHACFTRRRLLYEQSQHHSPSKQKTLRSMAVSNSRPERLAVSLPSRARQTLTLSVGENKSVLTHYI